MQVKVSMGQIVPLLSEAQFSLNPPLYLMLCILGASQASN